MVTRVHANVSCVKKKEKSRYFIPFEESVVVFYHCSWYRKVSIGGFCSLFFYRETYAAILRFIIVLWVTTRKGLHPVFAALYFPSIGHVLF